MPTTHLYLDQRGSNGEATLKVAVSKKSQTAFINIGVKILPSQWDKKSGKVKNHPNKVCLNQFISTRHTLIQNAMMSLSVRGELAGMNATQIKNRIGEELDHDNAKTNFSKYFSEFGQRHKAERTRAIYAATLVRMRKFDSKVTHYHFDDITKKWLDTFEAYWLANGSSQNTISIDLRNIRAAINDAIDNDVITSYVFRKKKIKCAPTRKRSLSVEKLRMLWNWPCEPWQQKYLDFFKLSFCLIGINLVDLTQLTEIEDGRICYVRQKTSRPYNIKVEPEALEIINRYRGKLYLLDIAENYKTYKSFNTKLSRGLQSIGKTEKVPNPDFKPRNRKHRCHIRRYPLFPDITLYWARHTWATIAAELDIPKETIAAALGHSNSDVTDVYIRFNYKKVDDANRKVLDYVLNGL